METKKFKVATYLKVTYIEKKTTPVDAYDEAEALMLCEHIHNKEIDAENFWDDVEVVDTLPISEISPMWIEENDEMSYPNYDPFDESILNKRNVTERGNVVDITKKSNVVDINKNKEPEHMFVRSRCCNAPWDISRLEGVWQASCTDCGKLSGAFTIQGPEVSGCTCDECKKKL